ncbi:MAG: reprolysin-like metallopeptidase [Chitinophagaceae bacterium]|nr:peptidase [Chitinophagaceae bacterium]MBK9464649.1 peptidase [Chitinophagaceae bacterium]MBK9659995.1 peptidase [Chitinophagaceae bacterium]MBL0069374.1 peptidase [Chitinophagaceae bacterium]
MRKFTLLIFMGLFCVVASAQQGYWSANSNKSGIATDKAVARISFPTEFKLFNLSIEPLRQKLFSIVGNQALRHSTVISLPNADGSIEQFEVYEASNFEPALQAQFPEIRAYSGRGITDKAATLKLSISPQGIQTMVFRANGPNEYIEPYSQDHTVYAAFKSQRKKGELPWVCSTPDQQMAQDLNQRVSRVESSTGELKTMRLAQSCNGEYANYFGATSAAQVALVLAAYNATLTRCNGCYEKDLAIHLNLIPTTTNVIYYDPATDPYTSLGNWNNQLAAALLANIGEANYDIGHMFGASGGGGNAGCIGCVCVDGQKGRGITSPADGIPQGDNFDIDYVAHEVGHQMGGNHTFSMSSEGTGVNKEVGSGITIMGYAGITAQDVAPHSIDIFHQATIQQIQANMAGKTCPVTTSLSGINATPVVAAVSNYTIPVTTPFALTGSATDADAGDVLTYCWEQNDNSTTTGAASVASPTKVTGPNWLSFPATTSSTRLMPRISTILSGASVTGPLAGGDAGANIEALSSVARTLNFRLTVRDNRPYNGTAIGQTQFTDMVVTVDATTGPFLITTQNSAVSYQGGSTQTVAWSVNGTTGAPINCANVKISFSTDGGITFPTVLAASTPNDGTEDITIPVGLTTTGRIKVEAIGNIFFDINNASITVLAPPAGFSFNSPAPIVSSCPTPTSLSTNLTATYFGGHSANINLTAAVVPSGSVTLTPATLTTGTTTTQVTLNNTNLLSPGNYIVTVTGTSTGVTTQTRDIVFTITPSAPVITTQPLGQTVCTGTNVTFTVVASGATSYQWQLSTDNGTTWGNVGGATSASYTVVAPTTAQNGHQYRVITSSICGNTTSNAVILNVVAPATITTQPVSATICEGGNASFNVVATTSIGVLTYQWELSTNGGTTWNAIPGATTSTFAQTNIPVGQNGYRFRVIASSGCGSVTSSVAILTVNAYPVISFTPSPVVCLSDAAFSLSATPGGGAFSGTGVAGSVFTPSVAGVGPKAITYTVSNAGCQSVVTRTILVNECAERHLTLEQYPAVIVYPIPSNGAFNIRLNTDLYTKLDIKLFNSMGQLVQSQVATGLTYGSIIPVQTFNLPNGTYQLFLTNDEKGGVSRKGQSIIIQKL